MYIHYVYVLKNTVTGNGHIGGEQNDNNNPDCPGTDSGRSARIPAVRNAV